MGKAIRRKRLKNPPKIRERSDIEIAQVVIAYRGLFKHDPFAANLMLMLSELSEYMPIPSFTDEVKLRAFIKKNQVRLEAQFVQRFRSVDHNVLGDAV